MPISGGAVASSRVTNNGSTGAGLAPPPAEQPGAGMAGAQTAALAAWMIGKVVLAAHMRAERRG